MRKFYKPEKFSRSFKSFIPIKAHIKESFLRLSSVLKRFSSGGR
jgi:hypothetical protein